MAGLSDLPEGVLEDIMSWLPPETLMEFKLVQKSWYLRINALVNNSEFVAKHLRNMKKKMLSSSSSCRFSFLFMGEQEIAKKEKEDDESEGEGEGDDSNDNVGYLLVLANDDHSDHDYIPCDTDHVRAGYYYKLHSQCDGIICLSQSHGTVYLLNPALRELKIVNCSFDGDGYSLLEVGFGYDSRANEYKVVAIAFLTMQEDVTRSKAKVYSLRSNSWRTIKYDIEMPFSVHDGVYHGGVYYWYVGGSARKMFSFDFSDEVFRDVPLPDWNQPAEDWLVFSKLSVWKESVVLLVYPDPEFYPMAIDIWVLDAKWVGGAKGWSYSWAKHLTIGPLVESSRVLGFWNNAKIIVEESLGDMKLYDIGSGVISRISDYLDEYYDERFVIYQKSLISVLRKEGRRPVVQL